MLNYPLKSSSTDMWLLSNIGSQKRGSSSSSIQLPRNLSEFQPNLWLSTPDQKLQEQVDDDFFDKWLIVDPLNKPCQTTVAPSSNEPNSHLQNISYKNSVPEWLMGHVPTESGFNGSSSSSTTASSECSSIEVLESGFSDFHLVTLAKATTTPKLYSHEVFSPSKFNNKWLCK